MAGGSMLPVVTCAPAVARPACHATGVTTHRDGAVVTASATAPSRRAVGKASPWRWLGARRMPSPAPVPD